MKKRTLKSALALALAFTMLYRMPPAAFAVEQSQLPTLEGGMMDEAASEGDSLNSFAPESDSQLEENPNTQSGQPSEEPAAGHQETGDPVSEKIASVSRPKILLKPSSQSGIFARFGDTCAFWTRMHR